LNVLLTGATGYLGKHLLAALLRDGHRVTALVRGGSTARLERALAPFALPAALRAAPRLVVVAGDVSVADCGLADGVPAGPFDALVHCAGLTRFDAHLADEVALHNLHGTRHAHALALRLSIPAFHHLGTAYVAGRATTPFGPADLDVGQDFNNPYERSKFEAERWLREAAAQDGVALTVYRPSIVVGGHPIGENNAVSTVYTFMKAVQFIRECCRRDAASGRHRFAPLGFRRDGEDFHIPVRVAADPASTVNLVAIDDVVDAVLAGLAAPAPTAPQVVTLTGDDIPLAAMERAICGGMRLSGVRLVPAADFARAPANALEAHFARMTRVYAPYLFNSPRFVGGRDARAVDPGALTRDYLARAAPAPRATVGALALDTLGIADPQAYFDALVGGAVGRHFLARHDYVDAAVAFNLDGAAPCRVRLRFAGGRARLLAPGDPTVPDCDYQLDSALFMRIVHGVTDLRAAFLAGKVKVRGDTELALKFGALLGQYYHRIDEHVIAELTA
jgi:nucleoside-diphosphate-sugar epimerase/putative sterol carrier protein